jgi:hypothetical protein
MNCFAMPLFGSKLVTKSQKDYKYFYMQMNFLNEFFCNLFFF